MSINRVNISGNLTRDPELRVTAAGSNILTFGVAVNDRRRNPKTQEWEDYPNYIDCVVFGSRAEPLQKFLSRGTKVAIEGKLRWSQWEKDGHKRSKIEVIVDECEFLTRSEGQRHPQSNQPNNYTNQYQNGPNSGYQQPTGYYPQSQAPNADVYASEDIPF